MPFGASSFDDKKTAKKLGRNLHMASEQKQIKLYFETPGCIGGLNAMKDEFYEQKIMNKLNALNLKARALEKIGLDEDQLKEIPPVCFHGYNFDSDVLIKIGQDGRLRSSMYEATWLFFSNSQVYIYSYKMDMISESKKETTEEYFYKDITNFATSSETVESEMAAGCGCTGKPKKESRDYNRFSLVVPGDKFFCSLSGVPDADQAINAMKQKLREKKG